MSEPVPYDACWQQVTCKQCGRRYQCIPSDDYWALGEGHVIGPEDGYCFTCMLAVQGIDADKVPVITMDTDGRLLDPREGRG